VAEYAPNQKHPICALPRPAKLLILPGIKKKNCGLLCLYLVTPFYRAPGPSGFDADGLALAEGRRPVTRPWIAHQAMSPSAAASPPWVGGRRRMRKFLRHRGRRTWGRAARSDGETTPEDGPEVTRRGPRPSPSRLAKNRFSVAWPHWSARRFENGAALFGSISSGLGKQRGPGICSNQIANSGRPGSSSPRRARSRRPQGPPRPSTLFLSPARDAALFGGDPAQSGQAQSPSNPGPPSAAPLARPLYRPCAQQSALQKRENSAAGRKSRPFLSRFSLFFCRHPDPSLTALPIPPIRYKPRP